MNWTVGGAQGNHRDRKDKARRVPPIRTALILLNKVSLVIRTPPA